VLPTLLAKALVLPMLARPTVARPMVMLARAMGVVLPVLLARTQTMESVAVAMAATTESAHLLGRLMWTMVCVSPSAVLEGLQQMDRPSVQHVVEISHTQITLNTRVLPLVLPAKHRIKEALTLRNRTAPNVLLADMPITMSINVCGSALQAQHRTKETQPQRRKTVRNAQKKNHMQIIMRMLV
jgi:hypothetical protein